MKIARIIDEIAFCCMLESLIYVLLGEKISFYY